MDKALLDIVNDFSQWKGNTYTLAVLLAEKQKELVKERLIEAGYVEAAEVV